jgi:hypothetical protein
MTKALGNTVSVLGTVACENFFATATGTGDTGATQGCYNKHLTLAGTNASAPAAATHCPHAMGKALCVAPAAATPKYASAWRVDSLTLGVAMAPALAMLA